MGHWLLSYSTRAGYARSPTKHALISNSYAFLLCRHKLRQIEISVMQYRESLEEQGLRDLDEIERKVASHRRRLQTEYGLSTPTDGANSRRSSGM